MKKNLVNKPRCNEHILPVPWALSLYRGSTVLNFTYSFFQKLGEGGGAPPARALHLGLFQTSNLSCAQQVIGSWPNLIPIWVDPNN